MSNAVVNEIVDVCRRRADDGPLVVTVYNADDIHHEYIIDEIEKQSDKIAMDSLLRPVQSVHRTLDFISELIQIGGHHRGSIHFYEHVTYCHFPIDKRTGIIISLAPRIDCPTGIYESCRSVIKESDGLV